jgi:hypothetical protein
MTSYHNSDEIEHDVVTACLVKFSSKNRARCCDQ